MVLNEDLEFVWSTYFGGTKQSGYATDIGYGITLTTNGKCYVVGGSESTLNFPIDAYSGAYNQSIATGYVDGFIANLSSG